MSRGDEAVAPVVAVSGENEDGRVGVVRLAEPGDVLGDGPSGVLHEDDGRYGVLLGGESVDSPAVVGGEDPDGVGVACVGGMSVVVSHAGV